MSQSDAVNLGAERPLIQPDTRVFPDKYLVVMRRLFKRQHMMWSEFEDIYQAEAVADEFLGRLGSKAGDPDKAEEALRHDQKQLWRYEHHAVPAILRRAFIHQIYDGPGLTARQYEDTTFRIRSIFEEEPLGLVGGGALTGTSTGEFQELEDACRLQSGLGRMIITAAFKAERLLPTIHPPPEPDSHKN
ncbi:hypothetical protein Rt10032_c11g4513 [Rhodotorula toruloides]|uniref:Uncharacterized protein n=1 Tax=Rhodotorula toruloides TaxID=5286 RepID=A0A511KKU4_RHOTO|nr:hypothetical protein Rt10032_c11g4513 [Rhodotorula toruloides]